MLIEYVEELLEARHLRESHLTRDAITEVFLPGTNRQVIMLFHKTEMPTDGKRGSRRSVIRRRQLTAVVFDFDAQRVEEVSLAPKDTLQILK